ncbi:MAG: NAD(P)H-hydrate dehydratase [Marinosulfonomonas sp.]|nr:NAD(P)H-hydrate dehydratase [Marinosulfonomonas sp.]
MTELLTAAQMRAIEQAAIDSGEVTGLELMERAGRGVVEAVFEEWPELAKTTHRAVVLCGPGNNGGDGFVVARLLKEWGWEVEVFLYGDADKLPPDAKVNCERWKGMGGNQKGVPPIELLISADIIVDALFGTGLTRALSGIYIEVVEQLSRLDLSVDGWPVYLKDRIVSIDLPSGVCSDSGMPLDESYWFEAALTVTFHTWRVGHFLDFGPVTSGRVICMDIGLGNSWWGADCRVLTEGDLEYGPSLVVEKSFLDHKYTHGHALILSGPSGKGGAARLAARGALRIGAGVVTVGCPPDAITENAAQLNAIMLAAVHDGDALKRVLEDERINALCLGPGLGAERARELVPVALASKAHIVLDADALTAFADDPETLFELCSSHRCVLTPHAGEFSRLFPDIAKRLGKEPMSGPAYSKVDATREAAKRAGCVVLFKGADTVIATPDGRASINSAHYERAAPWLATAGSGDVLAGFITGLLARGFAPMQAAETAAWLHVECARSFGAGLIAEDLPEELPKVFRQLEI